MKIISRTESAIRCNLKGKNFLTPAWYNKFHHIHEMEEINEKVETMNVSAEG